MRQKTDNHLFGSFTTKPGDDKVFITYATHAASLYGFRTPSCFNKWEKERKSETGKERYSRVRTLVLFSSSSQTDRTHKRFQGKNASLDRISSGIFPQSGAAQRSLGDGRASSALKLLRNSNLMLWLILFVYGQWTYSLTCDEFKVHVDFFSCD